MAATPEQVAALEAALYSGELTVEYGDRRVTYRSIADIERALARALKPPAEDPALPSGMRTYALFCRE